MAAAEAYALLEAWIGTPDWSASQRFLEGHRKEMLTPAVAAVLDEWVEEQPSGRYLRLHQGLLQLATQVGAEEAYQAVVGPEHLGARLETLTSEEAGERLLPYSWINLGLSEDLAEAWLQVGVASLMAGEDEEAEQAMRWCREATSDGELAKVLERLAKLAQGHSKYAAGLYRLISILAHG